jgi:PAS domain S-box-containing protein
MKFKLIIDKDKDEEVIITARARSPLVDEIEALISRHAGRIPGYTEDDINDGWLTQKDLIPEAQRQEYFKAVAAQFAEGDVVYLEHDIVRKDGRHVYVLCFAKRHYDSASKTIRTEVTIVDSSTIKAFNKKAGSGE